MARFYKINPMATPKKSIALRIILSMFAVIILAVVIVLSWASLNYKHIIMQRLPGIVAKGSDSLYHVSLQDIHINFFTGNATITGLRLWPDKQQANTLRSRHQKIPVTLSTVSVPAAEIYGISWMHLLTSHSLDCDHVIVHRLEWLMEAHPHPEDSLFTRKKSGKPMIERITIAHGDVQQPDVTYKYQDGIHFSVLMKGGTGVLNRFVYDMDDSKDTSNFLYANNGFVRPDSFIFLKQGSRYIVKHPNLDFETGERNVRLKSIRVSHLTDIDEQSGKVKEVYNLDFPYVDIIGTNWNKLVNDGILSADEINTSKSLIDMRYISQYSSPHNKMGDDPNQQLHQIGLKTYIKELNIKNSLFRYTEPNEQSQQEGIIELEGMNCSISNITNLDSVIRKNNNCIIKLQANYNHKSPVNGTIDLFLGDTHGHFKLDGYLENLDAADITKQTQALALMAVTSLHLSRIEMHQEGDETYVKGDLTMLYEHLKISLLKFKSDKRKSKRGPLSFLANALVLYPDNPMKGKEVRTVSTTFARDTTKGFISMIWENVLRGAQKTAVRSDALINIAEGGESKKGEKPKKGLFKRLFGKKH